jgi:hypothetical protein
MTAKFVPFASAGRGASITNTPHRGRSVADGAATIDTPRLVRQLKRLYCSAAADLAGGSGYRE